jgi:SagB-type dehydrogenase family enzyme
MSVAQDYLAAIVRRAREEMEPRGYVVNWADKPRQAKFYPGTDGFALPTAAIGADPVDEALRRRPGDRPDVPLPVLGDLLLNSYARLGRRLRINANNDTGIVPRYAHAKWSRGTASGGGIYPISVYWVTGVAGTAVPGLYHYSPFQHAMRRLLTGDVTEEVAAALGAAEAADQYLLLGLKFWQNAFKYNSFSYHATGFDVGTIVQTWQMLGAAHGLALTPSLWFDEFRLCRLLGVRPEVEGVFAVVPLGPARASRPRPAGFPPRVRYQDQELSRTVRTFEAVTSMQAATVAGGAERPDPSAVKAAEMSSRLDQPMIPLPAPAVPALGLRRSLRARMTSFGRFQGRPALGAAQLATMLAAGAAGGAFDCDVQPSGENVRLVKQYVFVNHVDGIEPGIYEHDPASNALRQVSAGGRGQFLRQYCTLSNYNLEQAAAVIVPAVRVPALLDALGDRGYRLATAVTGAVAQACYTAAASLGVGCGAALGLDTGAYLDELGLRDTDEIPLLLLMVGHERARTANYRFELV